MVVSTRGGGSLADDNDEEKDRAVVTASCRRHSLEEGRERSILVQEIEAWNVIVNVRLMLLFYEK
jgi:hypothetical protein